MNTSFTKFPVYQKYCSFPAKVPYARKEKYFIIKTHHHSKRNFSVYQIFLKHDLECVNPSQVNPVLAIQALFQDSKIPPFLSNSLLNMH
jgi:hypothetical protein